MPDWWEPIYPCRKSDSVIVYNAIQKEFGDEEFVTEPGPDVLRLRIAVTELAPTNPGVSMLVFCTPYVWIVDFADNSAKGSS